MKANRVRSLALILQEEGGWSNNPKDPGGATMKGVTQRVYDAFRRRLGQALRTVRLIADVELNAIYGQEYLDIVHFDEMPAGVDYAVADSAVNSGTRQAAKWLQAAVGAAVDGAIGFGTLKAVAAKPATKIIDAICDARLSFLHRLKTWNVFGKGWGRRVYRVRMMAQLMARQAAANDNRPQPLKAAA